MKKYIYEEPYGAEDDTTQYRCPTCMVELVEHQEICDLCGQELCWDEEELV